MISLRVFIFCTAISFSFERPVSQAYLSNIIPHLKFVAAFEAHHRAAVEPLLQLHQGALPQRFLLAAASHVDAFVRGRQARDECRCFEVPAHGCYLIVRWEERRRKRR